MVINKTITEADFAAFVMTYERPSCLQETLEILLSQTFPPAHILIIDNSESNDTQALVEKLSLPHITYHRMGYNAGPAGAAFFGLKELTSRSYKWIYWGDDDNPPRDKFVFENIFKKIRDLQQKYSRIGIIGGKGGTINRFTGRLRSLSNAELRKASTVEVDTVPGGHLMIVNSDVVKEGILPSPKLFFGFEELDFSIQVRKGGFRIFIDSEDWLRVRIAAQNGDNSFRYRNTTFGKAELLRRDYYSSRNLLYTYFHHRIFPANIYTFLKTILKAVAGFKYGWQYGIQCFEIQIKALCHFSIGRYGKQL